MPIAKITLLGRIAHMNSGAFLSKIPDFYSEQHCSGLLKLLTKAYQWRIMLVIYQVSNSKNYLLVKAMANNLFSQNISPVTGQFGDGKSSWNISWRIKKYIYKKKLNKTLHEQIWKQYNCEPWKIDLWSTRWHIHLELHKG